MIIYRMKKPEDLSQIVQYLTQNWGDKYIVSRGEKHDASTLPALVASSGDELVGLLTYRVVAQECEIVTLNAAVKTQGIGSGLINQFIQEMRHTKCHRIWLITTNDNLDALRFYQRKGFRLVSIHRDAVTISRRLKPSIPEKGDYGISLTDEIELEYLMDGNHAF